jgi:holliday junction DNA helicase RuvA
MITHLRGRLACKTPTFAVVDVGGVGYGVAISLASFERLPEPGAEIQVYTYLHVREDRMELFGFAEEEERELFGLLIEVQGIGPHSAQTILSGMSLRALQEAIFHGRVHELTAIKGIGKKTAERIVLDLRDRIRLPDAGRTGGARAGGPERASAGEEAVMALMALGVAGAAARQVVRRTIEKHGPDQSVEELIKRALKER